MRRYNRLINKGYVPITVDNHYTDFGSYTNVLMAKGLNRKTVRLNGEWSLSALQEVV
jgi:hypothetical protein